jgi:hypothetical protein
VENTLLLNFRLNAPRLLKSLEYTPADDERALDFATYFAKGISNAQIPNWPALLKLCRKCSNIPIGQLLGSSSRFHHIASSFSLLQESAEFCKLCEIILSSIKQLDTNKVLEINIAIAPQFLMVEVLSGLPPKVDYKYLRLCADPGKRIVLVFLTRRDGTH